MNAGCFERRDLLWAYPLAPSINQIDWIMAGEFKFLFARQRSLGLPQSYYNPSSYGEPLSLSSAVLARSFACSAA